MITQKVNTYIEHVQYMLSCILLQLNILCTSLVKLYFPKNNDSPVIHCSHVTASLLVLQCTGFQKWNDTCIKTFSTFSGVRIIF